MGDFNWSAYGRWENQKEWDGESVGTCDDCEYNHQEPEFEFNENKCHCECHWTKEDWAADEADRKYHEAKEVL